MCRVTFTAQTYINTTLIYLKEMTMQTLDNLQNDMRTAFMDGAPGMLVSASVWLVAGLVFLYVGAEQGIWALLIGGALIHPLAIIVLKLLGRSGKPMAGNPLNALAFASTIWLIVCCVLAYGLSRANVLWFFPAMMLTIAEPRICPASLNCALNSPAAKCS